MKLSLLKFLLCLDCLNACWPRETLCQLHKNGCQTWWNTMLTYQGGCRANEMCCQPNENTCITIFVNNSFYCYFFQTSLEENLEIHGFSQCQNASFHFSAKTCNFQKFKIWRKKRKKTLLLKHMVIVIWIQKHIVHLSSSTWVLPFCSFFSLFLGALVNLYGEQGFIKNIEVWRTKVNPKP